MNKLPDGRTQSNTLFEIIAQILNRPQSSIILHSQVLCEGCYSKILAIMDTQEKLQKLQADLMCSFDQTAFARADLSSTNNALQGFTESVTPLSNELKTEDPSLKNLTSVDYGDTTSSIDLKDPIEEVDPINLTEIQDPITGHKSKKYMCEKCGKSFSANSHWVEHMLIHIDVKPHICSFCNKSFRTSSMLKVHERGHMGLKPYECKTCGKSFK